MRIPSDLSGRIRLLEKAKEDPATRSVLSPEAASAFGAFPLGSEGDTLYAAVPNWADPDLYDILGRAIGRSVSTVPMDGEIVMGYIARVFLEDDFPNFHTFTDPDFVTEENLTLLVSGKVESLPDPFLHIPDGALLLLDLELRSDLSNLDRREGDIKFHSGSQSIPFTRTGDSFRAYGPSPPPSVKILLKLNYVYGGMESRHGFQSQSIESLPYPIHPTELQLVGAEPDGNVTFWVFDQPERVAPGNRDALSCAYHFLNFGNRYRRSLTLRVLGADIVPRDRLDFEEGESSWTLDDFDRWFAPVA
ncbi:MAG: hypothetical protein ACYTFG_16765 [Planctomycetota bacterium]